MSFSKRIRNIAITQLGVIKDRLDRIDHETGSNYVDPNIARNSRTELDEDPFGDVRTLRTPEQIAIGSVEEKTVVPKQSITEPVATSVQESVRVTLAHHYRVLGVEEGSDLSVVQNAYSRLIARCDPDRFEKGSEEYSTVLEIKKRVDASFDALRETLDPTVGRFDKLEF
ncbi:MAG: hypothetical protein ABJA67_04950 [Chthonomonadales bacterium]